MEDLIVITYASEARAEEMRKKILELQSEYLIELGDAVIAVKQEGGHVKLNQLVNTTASGAMMGGLWGAMIGTIFLMPLAGAALGAAAGALSGALTDIGVDDNAAKRIAEALQPGNAALFLLVRKMTTDKVLDALRGTGGLVLKTSLDRQKEQALRDALAGAGPPKPRPRPPGFGARRGDLSRWFRRLSCALARGRRFGLRPAPAGQVIGVRRFGEAHRLAHRGIVIALEILELDCERRKSAQTNSENGVEVLGEAAVAAQRAGQRAIGVVPEPLDRLREVGVVAAAALLVDRDASSRGSPSASRNARGPPCADRRRR